MAGCVFCDILRGSTAASIVYEDDEVFAFMDLFPVHGGHTLVIPREHFDDLESCPGNLAGRLFEVSARLGSAIVDAVGAAGFNVWTANGSAAGQDVFHLHFHIVPRQKGDGQDVKWTPHPEMKDRFDALLARLR